jgi:tetratricopeptide (TPR) repeat protein
MRNWDPEANDLFLQAIEIADPADRQRFLDGASAGNQVLRERVDALIREGEQAGSFLEHPAVDEGPTSAQDPDGTREAAEATAETGRVVGPYKLIEEIGEGGMGTVYLAQQTEPVRRLVAVKLVKAGMDSRQVLARFEAERQALALMDHPHIARVLDAGATPEGRPYFVMELVKGVPITQYCDDQRLEVRDRLALFADVCRAVQHAHQKGVIHRDLKPSNVLVAPYDGKPVVKVIDFGVAKAVGQPLTYRTLVTGLGAVVALRPDNPGLYVNRGGALMEAGEMKAALEDDLQALALAPNYAMVHNNLGRIYVRLFQYEKGLAHCSRAIELDPKIALAWSNRGDAYIQLHEYEKALADCTKGVELDPQSSYAWCLRGAAYCALKQYEKALADLLKAIELEPENAEAYYNLAFAHTGMGDLEKAIAANRAAIRLNPTHAQAHVNLGVKLVKLGRFTEALPYLRRAHELGSRKPGWPYRTAWMVQECERQIEIERKFQAFQEGTWTPSTPAERIDLAQQCYLKKRHIASARLYEEAFAKEPKLATDLDAAYRYNAACVAALAGSGQGLGAAHLDAEKGARLRREALDWLRADLKEWRNRLERTPDKARPVIVATLAHWLEDSDFAGVRGPTASSKLPESERPAWQELWNAVADVLARARMGMKPMERSGVM